MSMQKETKRSPNRFWKRTAEKPKGKKKKKKSKSAAKKQSRKKCHGALPISRNPVQIDLDFSKI